MVDGLWDLMRSRVDISSPCPSPVVKILSQMIQDTETEIVSGGQKIYLRP